MSPEPPRCMGSYLLWTEFVRVLGTPSKSRVLVELVLSLRGRNRMTPGVTTRGFGTASAATRRNCPSRGELSEQTAILELQF